jgi:hypothetical protein
VIALPNGYNHRHDTTVYHAENIKFVRSSDNNIYSLLVNDQQVLFDIKAFTNNLLKPESNLKPYKRNTAAYGDVSEYTLPDSVMTINKQKSKYSVTLKIENIRIYVQEGSISDVNEISGYYLVKIK